MLGDAAQETPPYRASTFGEAPCGGRSHDCALCRRAAADSALQLRAADSDGNVSPSPLTLAPPPQLLDAMGTQLATCGREAACGHAAGGC